MSESASLVGAQLQHEVNVRETGVWAGECRGSFRHFYYLVFNCLWATTMGEDIVKETFSFEKRKSIRGFWSSFDTLLMFLEPFTNLFIGAGLIMQWIVTVSIEKNKPNYADLESWPAFVVNHVPLICFGVGVLLQFIAICADCHTSVLLNRILKQKAEILSPLCFCLVEYLPESTNTFFEFTATTSLDALAVNVDQQQALIAHLRARKQTSFKIMLLEAKWWNRYVRGYFCSTLLYRTFVLAVGACAAVITLGYFPVVIPAPLYWQLIAGGVMGLIGLRQFYISLKNRCHCCYY